MAQGVKVAAKIVDERHFSNERDGTKPDRVHVKVMY